MLNLIGRKSQIEFLQSQNRSSEAKFIALVGRRRIGKTYLVRQVFAKKKEYTYFEVVAKRKATSKEHINIFLNSYEETFKSKVKISREIDWQETLKLLSKEADKRKKKPFIIFIDELPWLAQTEPSFLSELEHIWNSDWVKKDNLRLIVCGSATSWMKEEIFENTGGLFNRLTGRMEIPPFSVEECQEYLSSRKIKLSKDDLFEYYLIFGGIPYYFSLIQQSLVTSDTVQKLLFRKDGLLKDEFPKLIEALFKESNAFVKILSVIGRSRYGLNRAEISTLAKIPDGGTLERGLKELVDTNFLTRYTPFGYQEKGAYFRLTDEFLYFYVTWLEKPSKKGLQQDKNYFQKQIGSGKYYNWRGAAFEVYCQKNSARILEIMGISGIRSEVSTWRTPNKKTKEKLQIDLVIDRADGIVTLVEIKSSRTPISFTTKDLKEYQRRKSLFQAQTKTKKYVNSVLVAYAGVINEIVAKSVFDKIITYEELIFK